MLEQSQRITRNPNHRRARRATAQLAPPKTANIRNEQSKVLCQRRPLRREALGMQWERMQEQNDRAPAFVGIGKLGAVTRIGLEGHGREETIHTRKTADLQSLPT